LPKREPMNLILLFPNDFISETAVRLTGDRAKHILEIHRASIGKILKVGVAGGGLGRGTITETVRDSVTLSVILEPALPEIPLISLIVALPRPQTLKKILEIVGAVGVKQIFFVGAERVQKSFFSSTLLKDESWKRHLYLGMEQGSTTYLPEIEFFADLGLFFKEGISKIGNSPEILKYIAHPGVSETLWNTPLAASPSAHSLFAVGPEGGWIEPEVERFRDLGFQPLSLGKTIHRVENAVATLLAQIELLRLKSH
jgi:16S rRNA (uracil1498-N3)-methyltransferase